MNERDPRRGINPEHIKELQDQKLIYFNEDGERCYSLTGDQIAQEVPEQQPINPYVRPED
jgi:hypothetical protein